MEVDEQIKVFREFIEQNYYPQLLEAVRKGNSFIILDFSQLIKFNTDITEEILENPEELLKAAELAIKDFDLPKKVVKFTVRFLNIPDSQKVLINEIRSKHLNKFICVEGVVRQKSDVRPHVTAAKFECPSCGNILNVLQLDTKYKEPTRCGCGRKGKFKEISKELVDGQGLVLEETSDDLDGAQPKRINVFLKDDLVSPFTERKTSPGSRIRLVGWVTEVPIALRSGGQSTKYELIIEANSIEPLEDDLTNVKITDHDMEEIRKIAESPNPLYLLSKSLAPSIHGHDKIKEAIVLQLAGGCRKTRPDGVTTRGDMHMLLIGDPGCIAGDSMVSLYHKGMKQIKEIGKKHLQPLRELVTKIRKSPKDLPYDYTSNFQIYKNQPTLKLITETGKEIICTYNQPFLTKKGWCRADKLNLDEKIRVMPKIPNYIKAYKKTGFVELNKSTGKLKENVIIPKLVTPELAGLYGYVLGDGSVHPRGYTISCYINDEEKDLIPKLSHLWKETFNVEGKIITRKESKKRTIKEKNGLREFYSTKSLHSLEINSRQVTFNLSFLKEKRVPQLIFESPLKVISNFLSWLFEADGCTFSTGRGKTSIQLKSVYPSFLRDVQLLLLYYGIQARIIEDNLCVRKSRDINIFAKKIGFVSKKKKEKLVATLKEVKNKNDQQKRKTPLRYEKISLIEPFKKIDVYDFEVPKSKCFIANGIICHNSGKSQLLKRITKIAPKARFTSGKGATAAGLTASVVKDEFLGGWSLEAGTLVLANRGFAVIDEMDKMNKEDRSALHEALEQQTISISKANIQATLRCETTVLAAANPKFGRFDPYDLIANQINLPPTLINRFDLIFPVKDIPGREKDEMMATFILDIHKNPEKAVGEIPTETMKKYFSFIRDKINPKMSDEAIEEIKEYYVSMRNSGSSDEAGIKSIPITARQLEALVRLSEAAAKIRLASIVNKNDAQKAIELIDYCLNQIAKDSETGKIDIDRIGSRITATQRSSIGVIKELISSLEEQLNNKMVPIENIIEAAQEKNISKESVEDILEKLRRSGDVFEPKRGFVQRL
ncbi:MAG: ATP-binding protein [Nanoarchaeota archaeon]|nr:ATP-binding protein [Nanoarchaeota archaeon]MBU1644668.1 ATP-binding protein [Nanoarchaeota archaeon]MBU1976563.1 ATP-binding protein [Nanoarchaeota archaeon]